MKNLKTTILITLVLIAFVFSVGSIAVKHSNEHKVKYHATYEVDGHIEYRKSLHK